MINIKTNSITSAVKLAYFYLLRSKEIPNDKELIKEDSAVISISNIAKEPFVISIVDRKLSCNYDWKKYFPDIDTKKIKEELEYWEDEFIGKRKMKTMIDYLRNYPQSRRAIVSFWHDSYRGPNDKCSCITYLYFRLRNNKLEMHSHVRANNLFFLVFLDIVILSQFQKLVANKLGLDVGDYVHFIDSLHFYHKESVLIKKQVKYMNISSVWKK